MTWCRTSESAVPVWCSILVGFSTLLPKVSATCLLPQFYSCGVESLWCERKCFPLLRASDTCWLPHFYGCGVECLSVWQELFSFTECLRYLFVATRLKLWSGVCVDVKRSKPVTGWLGYCRNRMSFARVWCTECPKEDMMREKIYVTTVNLKPWTGF